MTREEMMDEEPELIGRTYDELCFEQDRFEVEESDEPKVYFSACCGTEIKDPVHFDYQRRPDCGEGCIFKDVLVIAKQTEEKKNKKSK